MSTYLATADRLLTTTVPGARGTWPRACAWLLRPELEAALDRFWARVRPDIGAVRAQRPKLLMLPAYAGEEVARRAGYLWWALSRAGHHHRYELGLTVGELLRLRAELVAVAECLQAAAVAGSR